MIRVDVRVLAATNKDLGKAVETGSLPRRLVLPPRGFPIRSPALRERVEDIPVLAQAFMEQFASENGVRPKPIDEDVMRALASRKWPGNVRELKNVVERSAILCGDRVTIADLPEDPHASPFEEEAEAPLPAMRARPRKPSWTTRPRDAGGHNLQPRSSRQPCASIESSRNESTSSIRSARAAGTSRVQPSFSASSARTCTRRSGPTRSDAARAKTAPLSHPPGRTVTSLASCGRFEGLDDNEFGARHGCDDELRDSLHGLNRHWRCPEVDEQTAISPR